jgi:hypothetical protein
VSLATLITTAPDTSHGVEIGYDSWRLVVDAVLPSQTGAVVGTAVVGTTNVAVDEWVDITDYVRGLDITRGADGFDSLGDPGTLDLTLASPAHIFAPWLTTLDSFNGSARKFKAGLLIRVGLVKSGDWWPIITTEVETWKESTFDNDTDIWVDVVGVETSARLGRTDVRLALSGNYQLHDAPSPGTIEALVLDEASWPYGDALRPDPLNPWMDGETFLSMRLGAPPDDEGELEGTATSLLRLIAHSAAIDGVRSDPKGRLEFFHLDDETAELTLDDAADIIVDPIVFSSDPIGVINRVDLQCRNNVFDNGAPRTETTDLRDSTSITRYGETTLTIDGLLTDTLDASAVYAGEMLKAWAQRIVDDRKNAVNVVDGVTLDERHLEHIVGTELDAAATVSYTPRTSPATLTATGRVRKINHSINPALAPVKWTATYGLDVTALEASS